MKHIIIILKFLINNFLLITAIVIAIYRLMVINLNEGPEVVFLNIGQGDATLVQQGHFQILIDAGPDDSVLYELPKYMPRNDRSIELVILTHSHDDHIQGLFSILNNYSVKKIVYEPSCFKYSDFERIRPRIKDTLYPSEEEWKLQYKDILLTLTYPFKMGCSDDNNQNSIITKLTIHNTNILLMGDAGIYEEDYLLNSDVIGQTDILKAGHHCSDSATSEMFLSEVYPTLAICSCGKGNKFGHPSSETLQKFKRFNVQYLVTYQTGNIVVKFKKE